MGGDPQRPALCPWRSGLSAEADAVGTDGSTALIDLNALRIAPEIEKAGTVSRSCLFVSSSWSLF